MIRFFSFFLLEPNQKKEIVVFLKPNRIEPKNRKNRTEFQNFSLDRFRIWFFIFSLTPNLVGMEKVVQLRYSFLDNMVSRTNHTIIPK